MKGVRSLLCKFCSTKGQETSESLQSELAIVGLHYNTNRKNTIVQEYFSLMNYTGIYRDKGKKSALSDQLFFLNTVTYGSQHQPR